MKALVFGLLALCSASWAGQVVQINGATVPGFPTTACGTVSGFATNAMNKVTPGVKSATINTAGAMGYFVHVTSPANVAAAPVLGVEFSSDEFNGFVEGYRLVGGGSMCIPPLNRYMRFVNRSGPQGVTPTGAYSAISITVNYIIGRVVASTTDAGMAGSLTTVAADLATVKADLASVKLNTGAYLTVSTAAKTAITTDSVVNVSAMAGTSTGPFWLQFSTLGADSLLWAVDNVAAAPDSYHLLSLSNTPIVLEPLAPGELLHLKTSGTGSATVKVTIKKKQ